MGVHPYLGTNVSPIQVQELMYRGLLQKDETLLALFDGILFDENGKHVGGLSVSDYVALTNERVITWARGLFSDIVDGFQWKDVDIIEARTWDPLHGSVSLAFRIAPAVAVRQPRVAVKGRGTAIKTEESERVVVNKLDFVPAADIPVMEEMIAWTGDQVVSGLTGEPLLKAFAEMFTHPFSDGAQAPQPMLASESSSSSEAPAEPREPRKRWWSFGKKGQDEVPQEFADNPERLVAAYELQQSNQSYVPPSYSNFPTASGNTGPFSRSTKTVTSVIDRVGVYDFSRGLRMLIEAPKQVGDPLNQLITGASEAVESLQDSEFGKKASAGLQLAMNGDQQPPSLLKMVAPVVQAVLGGGDEEDEKSNGSGAAGGSGSSGRRKKGKNRKSSRRRIQVTAANSRRQQGRSPVAAAPAPAAAPVRVNAYDESFSEGDAELGEQEASSANVPVPRTRVKMRRQVAIRKVESDSDASSNGAFQRRGLDADEYEGGDSESDDSFE
jgi:hypothetical protein